MPDSRPDILAMNRAGADTVVELDMEITGVRRSEQLPTHPLVAAYKAYESFSEQAGLNTQRNNWVAQFDQDIVPLFLFDAHVKDARIFNEKTHKTVAKLELREPRQPDYALLKLVEPERVAAPSAPYGPDVVGFQLGMSFDRADKIIREHMTVGRTLSADRAWQVSAATGRLKPFTSGRLYESQDGTERMIIFDEPPAAPDVVLGIVRQVNFAKGKLAPAAIYAQLEKKYGAPTRPNPSGAGQLWLEGAAKEDALSRLYCSPSHNASNLYSIWRDPDANPSESEPARPIYGENGPITDLQGMQDYMKKQQEYLAAVKKWQEKSQLQNTRVPSLDCLGCDEPAQLAGCSTGLAATFDVKGSNEWDRLIIQAFDYRVYAQQFSESKRLIEKGESDTPIEDTVTDLKL